MGLPLSCLDGKHTAYNTAMNYFHDSPIMDRKDCLLGLKRSGRCLKKRLKNLNHICKKCKGQTTSFLKKRVRFLKEMEDKKAYNSWIIMTIEEAEKMNNEMRML